MSAVVGLSVLAFGLSVPLLRLVFASDPAPFCCGKGRCCCAAAEGGAAERSCLRRGCGCDDPHGASPGAPPRIEAVLSDSAPRVNALPVDVRWSPAGPHPIARADEPPVPPPRRALPV